MNIRMAGLDWHVPIQLREQLSFPRGRVVELNRLIRDNPGVEGCALLSTCNRTELYLSCAEGTEPDPAALLCAAAGVDYAAFAACFTTCAGEAAARRLMEVAGGLRSQIWGEDQILTQVKGAISATREAGTADGVLETLFRSAAAAGKALKTKVRLTGVPRSAAQSAVERLGGWPPPCWWGRDAPSPSPCAATTTGRRWCPPGAPWPPTRSDMRPWRGWIS